ncbi:MAG: site-specific integrase [Erysipelotrichaceae bacterium]|nr:site-specific integrase [Erysipelotrichaceae bacterium]
MGKSFDKEKELGKNISQRKDGLYQAAYMDENGKRKYMYGRNLRKLQQELKYKQQEIESIKLDSDMALKTGFDYMPTFGEVWAEYCENRLYETGLKEKTIQNYKAVYNATIKNNKQIENVRVNQFTRGYCEKLLRQVKKEHGTSVQNFRIVSNNVFNYAIDCELIDHNPMHGITLKYKPKEKETLTYEEQIVLLETEWNEQYKNFIIIALQTGMRCSEICGLTWDDINYDSGFINVHQQVQYARNHKTNHYEYMITTLKTRKSVRKIPLTDSALNAFKRQEKYRKKQKAFDKKFNNLVFLTKQGTPFCADLIDEHLRLLLKKTNLNHTTLSCHMFRHTFASQLYVNGLSAKDIQAILGHEKVETTLNIYTHLMNDNDSLKEKVNSMIQPL